MNGISETLRSAERDDREIFDAYWSWQKALANFALAEHADNNDRVEFQHDVEAAVETLGRYCANSFSGARKQLRVAAWVLHERALDKHSFFGSLPVHQLVTRVYDALAAGEGYIGIMPARLALSPERKEGASP